MLSFVKLWERSARRAAIPPSSCSMTDASTSERRSQLRSINDSLVSGSLSRQEYDELLPFLASPAAEQAQEAQQDASDQHASPPRNVHFADGGDPPAPEPIQAPPHYSMLASAATPVTSGLQLRCPACSSSNDTARGPRCYVCDSRLTVADELSAAITARSYAGQRRPIVTPPSGAFSASDDGRVVIHDGFFSCAVQDTQFISTADGSAYQVFVMCCRWQPRSSTEQLEATWYVSQRFSQFEKLHKALKRRLSRSTTASLPPFPAKYHLTDRLEKRKLGLGTYMPRLLEMCGHLPNAQPVPELDEFLDVSHQVQLYRAQRPPVNSAPVVHVSPSADRSQRSAASTLTSASSPFTGPARRPSEPVAPPMDETELAQAEGAVRLLAQAVRNARGDVRGDGAVQHHLDMCVQLAPGLQRSADLDNPFANADLIPRAMQCQEDLQQAVAMYNDALLAVSEVAPVQQQAQPAQHAPHPESPRIQAQPALHVRNVVPASAA